MYADVYVLAADRSAALIFQSVECFAPKREQAADSATEFRALAERLDCQARNERERQ